MKCVKYVCGCKWDFQVIECAWYQCIIWIWWLSCSKTDVLFAKRYSSEVTELMKFAISCSSCEERNIRWDRPNNRSLEADITSSYPFKHLLNKWYVLHLVNLTPQCQYLVLSRRPLDWWSGVSVHWSRAVQVLICWCTYPVLVWLQLSILH